MSLDSEWRLTAVLQEFVNENDINKEIQLDEDERAAYVAFSTGSKVGPLQCFIQIAEEPGYIMFYLILGQGAISKENLPKAYEKINQLNIKTKMGAFQVFEMNSKFLVRHYLGFPADDVAVDEWTVIHNLLAEGISEIEDKHEELLPLFE